jgi:ABC-type amino acid transport substrate-binding protein
LEPALLEGVGDVIGFGVIVTPEREKKVLFATPFASDVNQVVVAGRKFPALTTLQDISGKEIYANPLTVFYDNLQTLSSEFQRAGKPRSSLKRPMRTSPTKICARWSMPASFPPP